LELGQIVLARAKGQATYPARFQLVLAANPCPCGLAIGKGLECRCNAPAKRRYMQRLSAPFRDRIELQIEVDQVSAADFARRAGRGESSARVARRVAAARAAQRERLGPAGWSTNREAEGAWLRERLGEGSAAVKALESARESGVLSLRGADAILRVAWTIADLEGRAAPKAADIDAAFALRSGLNP
jgi:magnesium chelatase family protein